MKKILLPTDFSNNASNAITYALHFFKDQKCKFFFLHTYTPAFYRVDYSIGGPAQSGIPDSKIDIIIEKLENTVEDIKIKNQNSKHTYETISAFNILTDEVNKVVEKEGVDMIVMGTQGATGAREILFGSNTVFVMRKATVPVLAIPENYEHKEIESILFPTDFSTFYKRKELKTLVEIAKTNNAKITVIHLVEEDELSDSQKTNKLFLSECFETINHTFEDINKTYLPHAVNEYIHEKNFDLLVMMNKKHSFLEKLLYRQNVDSIGFHVKIPFLVLRDTSKVLNK